jgi:hypothetical protein
MPACTSCIVLIQFFFQYTQGGAKGCYQTTIINNGGGGYGGYGGYGGSSCQAMTVTQTQYQTVTKVSFVAASYFARSDIAYRLDNDSGYNGHNEGDPDSNQDRHRVRHKD